MNYTDLLRVADALLGILETALQPVNNDDHPLHGKRVIVSDSSYAIDKETGCKANLNGTELIIVSDPYVEEVKPASFFDHGVNHLFVDAFSILSSRKYRILFNESDIIDSAF